MSTPSVPPVDLDPGATMHGFLVERVEALPRMRASVVQCRHDQSGARLLHVRTDDPDNLMAITFRTPPPDNTGLPHILEHTVLCGSEKYPLKDPFVELLRVSLATFLNAFTYLDRTAYPCSSMVERDFYHLADVYCDAVFHPRITEAHFRQEGHHLDLTDRSDPESPLRISGIVYNEMKGAYSNLDTLIAHRSMQAIFPDTPYGRDSGGDPEAIPELTHAQFREFHRQYYHPSNAWFFFYGNLPTEQHLRFLNEGILNAFDRLPIDSALPAQPRWTEPQRVTVPFSIAAHEDPATRGAAAVSWLANEVIDRERTLAMHLLDGILLDNAASPLRKALIDAKIGTELISSAGYDAELRDTCFSVGLKGMDPERDEEMLRLVLETCSGLARNGLGRDRALRSLHQLEYAVRSVGASYPLTLMDRVMNAWLHGADPVEPLRLEAGLDALRAHVESDDGYLERLLGETLVDNPHRALVRFVPDKELAARREAAFADRMQTLRAGLSADDITRIRQEAEELEAMQSAPNPPEAVATLPRLARTDVPDQPPVLDTALLTDSGPPCLYTDMHTGGICYLQLAVEVGDLSTEELNDLPLYLDALREMGAGELDYVGAAEREGDVCGGFGAGVDAGGRVDDAAHYAPALVFRIRTLEDRVEAALDHFADRILRPAFDDPDRLREVIRQGREERRSRIVPGGEHFAVLRAGRRLHAVAALRERLGGATQIHRYDDHLRDVEADPQRLIERLNALHARLADPRPILASTAGPEAALQTMRDRLNAFPRSDTPLPSRPDQAIFPAFDGQPEGLAAAADVAFVARTADAVNADHPLAPALLVLMVQLSFGYMWEEVRVKNGAYGGHASFNLGGGAFSFSSYRDPCIAETLAVIDRAPAFALADLDLSADAVEQAVIGAIKTQDRPVRAAQAAGVALGRHRSGLTPAFRSDFRSRLLAVTPDAIRDAARQILQDRLPEAATCVLSSREKLEAANDGLDARRRFRISDL